MSAIFEGSLRLSMRPELMRSQADLPIWIVRQGVTKLAGRYAFTPSGSEARLALRVRPSVRRRVISG